MRHSSQGDRRIRASRHNLLLAGAVAVGLLGLFVSWEAYLHWRYPQPVEFLRDDALEYRPQWAVAGRQDVVRFREREYSTPKPHDVFRVLALGGSTTWGHLLAGNQAWPALLENALNDASAQTVEVINAGVKGWSAEHLRRVAPRLVQLLTPNLVLVMTGWNWCGVAEPLNWSPMSRLSNGQQWLHGIVDSYLMTDLRLRLARARGGETQIQDAPSPEDYTFLRRKNSDCLVAALADLDRYFQNENLPHVLITPPALLPETPLPEEQLQALEQLIRPFNYCGTNNLREVEACHRVEYSVLRRAVASGTRGGQWEMIDGDAFIDHDILIRKTAFMDHMHLSVEGHAVMAQYLAHRLLEGSVSGTGNRGGTSLREFR